MIFETMEPLMTLSAAAKLLPSSRRGKQTHATTLYRWTTRGLRGIKLRYVQFGGTRMVNSDMLDEFFAALTRATTGDSGAAEGVQGQPNQRAPPE